MLFSALEALIAQHKVPVMIAISIGNGGGDAQGSERGLEYDTMSGTYAEFVETEVLPMVETRAHMKLTHDPDGRATMGGSSGGACALIMAWYHPELYHRVLSYSGTFVNQHWPYNSHIPHGAWEFHERLIAGSPKKPIRLWLEVGDRDLLNPNVMRDNMHDWVAANENMARVLAAKGRSAEARAELERAVELASNHAPRVKAVLHAGLGAALQRAGDLDGAESHYRAALGYSSDNVTALHNLGGIQFYFKCLFSVKNFGNWPAEVARQERL